MWSNAPGTFESATANQIYMLGFHADQEECNTFAGCHTTFSVDFDWSENIYRKSVAGYQCEGSQSNEGE
jgi:LPXTG-motif cell wall-anchored protein